jgi:hypothetical protein
MIDALTNIYFYSIIVITYLIIIIFILARFRLFNYFDKTKSYILNNRVILILKNAALQFSKNILTPSLGKFIHYLADVSLIINKAEARGPGIVSHDFSESFTLISLLTRKCVEGGFHTAMSVMLALSVLIYFILTML